MISRVLRVLGEALLQVAIISLLIFILERVGVFMTTVTYFDEAIYIAETGIIFTIVLLIALGIVNTIFLYVPRWSWWMRAFLESIVLIPIYFITELTFRTWITFDHSPIYVFIFVLLGATLTANLIVNFLIRPM
jgi:hypothetical protein